MNQQSCPFIGLRNDPDSYVSFASMGNTCFRQNPPFLIQIEHQETCCLTNKFQGCPVFQAQGKLPVPKELIEPDLIRKLRLMRIANWLLVGLLITISAGLIFYFRADLQTWLDPTHALVQPVTTYAAPTLFAPPQPTDAYQPGMLSQPAFLATPRAPEPTPRNTAVPDINYPTESGNLVVHEILAGESLEFLANQYKTTIEAIRDININLKSPLWVGDMIVLPEGMRETASLPLFETIYLPEKKSVKTIAKENNVDVKLLKQFNSRIIISKQDQDIILGDQWVLLPRPRKADSSP